MIGAVATGISGAATVIRRNRPLLGRYPLALHSYDRRQLQQLAFEQLQPPPTGVAQNDCESNLVGVNGVTPYIEGFRDEIQ